MRKGVCVLHCVKEMMSVSWEGDEFFRLALSMCKGLFDAEGGGFFFAAKSLVLIISDISSCIFPYQL